MNTKLNLQGLTILKVRSAVPFVTFQQKASSLIHSEKRLFAFYKQLSEIAYPRYDFSSLLLEVCLNLRMAFSLI